MQWKKSLFSSLKLIFPERLKSEKKAEKNSFPSFVETLNDLLTLKPKIELHLYIEERHKSKLTFEFLFPFLFISFNIFSPLPLKETYLWRFGCKMKINFLFFLLLFSIFLSNIFSAFIKRMPTFLWNFSLLIESIKILIVL